MLKSILIYCITFLVVSVLIFLVHSNFVESLTYSLKNVYMFFAVSSFIICTLFKLGSGNKKIKDQLGFIYLAAVVVKLAFFGVIFYDSVFTEPLTMKLRISLLIPLFSLLIFEVFFISKILNQKL